MSTGQTARLLLDRLWGDGRRTRLTRSTILFGLVGISGIGVNQLVLWVLVDLVHVDYLVAAIVASVASTLSNFALTERVVFPTRPGSDAAGVGRRLLAFSVLTALMMPLRLVVLYVFTSILGVHYLLSNLIAICVVFALRYVVCDRVIWRSRRPRMGSGVP